MTAVRERKVALLPTATRELFRNSLENESWTLYSIILILDVIFHPDIYYLLS